MPQHTNLLAIDLGAESGRGILGRFDGSMITLEVLHRFANGPVTIREMLYWDPLRLWSEMKHALALAAQQGTLASLGVDTWGVDFALLDEYHELLGNPRHYRDPHTETTMQEAFKLVPAERIFAQTGIQFMRFNSLFQLLALNKAKSTSMRVARHMLFMPDLFHYWFSGELANEASIVSTSQCYNPTKRDWAWPLIEQFALPHELFGKMVPSGTKLGNLLPSVAQDAGITTAVPVIAPASHDTAAAVAAVPARGDDWCYLSSGTWSLMGVELPKPVINEEVRAANFTNEGGVEGTTRFLKNIMGMWLVQECKRSFARAGHDFNYDQLAKQAEEATPFAAIINPDDASFLLPRDMPTAITEFCQRTGQTPPASAGAFIRCCLESLALRYRWTKEKLTALTGRKINVIHIVGGGCQNKLLNQMTADATGCQVLAGPVEATALGNLLTQAMGLKLVGSLQQLRDVIRCSFPLEKFEPASSSAWNEAYQKFLQWV